ncbi:MAG TPA: hypothetical protein VHU81_07515 [Thermoanaerobaculia bacterium]|jgi:hypothetical protein|nr:hypothetical protein [Thermoanaerobaculia bacterium]
MRKTALRLSGLVLVLAAVLAPVPRAQADRPVCNLLCIQGFHCCIQAGQAACCPDHP